MIVYCGLERARIRATMTPMAVALIALLLGGCTYTQLAHSPPETVEYVAPAPYYYDGPFYELDQWGDWIETAPMGWVWRPYVGMGWQPYYHGNWAWTGWGWTWVSYEPFGWATYHYGFWHYDAIYGWIWLPGDQWFPARVSWMYHGDYVFWAPIPPPGYYIPDPWDVHVDFIWMGVRADHFVHSDIGRYRVKKPQEVWRRVSRTQVRRDAPGTAYIEQRTRTTIRPVDVKLTTVKKGGKEYKKLVLPPAEKRAVDRYEKQRDESIRPRVQQPKSTTTRYRGKQYQPPSKQPESRERTRPASKKNGSKKKPKGKSGEGG